MVEQHNPSELLPTPEQVENARAVIEAILDDPARIGAVPEDGSYSKRVSDDGTSTEDIRVGRGPVYLEVSRRLDKDDTGIDPNRSVSTLSVLADLTGIARASVMISDGRILSADFRDDYDPTRTLRNGATHASLENALIVIEAAQEELKN